MKKEQNRVFLGYMRNAYGKIEMHPLEAPLVLAIYHAYVDGASMQRISEILEQAHCPSPRGKAVWGRQAISNLLCNEKYMGNEYYPQIVPNDIFAQAKAERERRAGSEEFNGVKTKRAFNTSTPLTGMLFCAECGKAYRRITRASGEVTWRCANRVEHGSEICKLSPTIKEKELIDMLADELSIPKGEAQGSKLTEAIKNKIKSIIVAQDGSLTAYLRD